MDGDPTAGRRRGGRNRGAFAAARPAPARAPPSPRVRAAATRAAARHRAGGTGADDRYAYLADGESTDRLRELRSGARRPEAELDLHGQTAAAASAALARFVASARQQGQRAAAGDPRARPRLGPGWSRAAPAGHRAAEPRDRWRRRCWRWSRAPPALGGAGAALVLLRRAFDGMRLRLDGVLTGCFLFGSMQTQRLDHRDRRDLRASRRIHRAAGGGRRSAAAGTLRHWAPLVISNSPGNDGGQATAQILFDVTSNRSAPAGAGRARPVLSSTPARSRPLGPTPTA